MASIERNGPCPCGSGIKYKKCCEGVEQKTPIDKRLLVLLGVIIVAAVAVGGVWGFEMGMRVGIVGVIFAVGANILLKAPKKKRDRDSGSNIDFGR